MLNKYFEPPSTPQESEIVNCMVTELIQISGMDVYYIPRELNRLDNLFGEDVLSSFESKYMIEMYLNDVFEFGGQGDMMSNFGLEIRDEINLTVSSTRFREELDMNVPLEGDLIFVPKDNALFEITYVDFNKKFFAHNTTPKFDIKCELFEYSNENIEIGIESVDMLDNTNMVEDEFGDLQPVSENETDNTAINDLIMSKFGEPDDEDNNGTDEHVPGMFDPSNPFG